MEITTTMVRFAVKKANMANRSDNAVQICKSDKENALNEWVPLKKVEWAEDKAFPEYNQVIMAKWLFFKGNLPKFIKGYVEFFYRNEVSGETLLHESYENRNIIQ